jgi:thioredoxin reductase (NADPH)
LEEDELDEIAIIGCGPAGVSAAIYLKRAGIDPIVFEKGEIGGLLRNANLVENYPGFPQGISGSELVEIFKKQLNGLGIEITHESVSKVYLEEGNFRIKTDESEVISSALIVASGTKPKKLGIPLESELLGRKLFYEIKDIPPPTKNDTYVIIGSGDCAFDYALNIASEVKSVDIIFRGKHPKCLPLLSERVAAFENIRPHPKLLPREFEENEGITTKCISASGDIDLPSDYVLVAGGREPNCDFLPELVDFEINDDGGCDIPGLFIAGDVRRGKKRQVGIAVGDGIICAMSACDFLCGEEKK